MQGLPGSKKTGWDVMICGDMDDTDDSEMMPQRYAESDVQDSSVTGNDASLLGEVLNVRKIPTPGWRKLTEGESDQSGAST